MTASEAARKNWKDLKGRPAKEILAHIITYYGFSAFLIGVLVVSALGYLVHVLTLKDEVLNVNCLGPVSVQSGAEDFANIFAEYAGINLDQCEVNISTSLSSVESNAGGSYESVEVLTALIASQAVDIVAADIQYLTPHMYQNYFADLSKILSAEQIETYGESFLYVDMEVVRQIKNTKLPEDMPEYPDPTRPENMIEPVPVAIRLSESVSFVKQFFLKNEGHTAIAFAVNAKNLDNALTFLEFIHR